MNEYFQQAKTFLTPYISSIVTQFKQFSPVKQALISTSIVIGSSVAYGIISYNINKLLYPRKPIIDYKIHGDISSNNGIIFFLHGWPDFSYIWEIQIKYFISKGYCCITLELPNFNISKPIQNPWGYKVSTITEALGNTMYNILSTNNKLSNNDISIVS